MKSRGVQTGQKGDTFTRNSPVCATLFSRGHVHIFGSAAVAAALASAGQEPHDAARVMFPSFCPGDMQNITVCKIEAVEAGFMRKKWRRPKC